MFDSGGRQIVLRHVMSDKSAVVRFQKSGCCLAVPMLVPVPLGWAVVMAPALASGRCSRPVALAASLSNQCDGFGASAGAFHAISIS